jgi:hypothetical protein
MLDGTINFSIDLALIVSIAGIAISVLYAKRAK